MSKTYLQMRRDEYAKRQKRRNRNFLIAVLAILFVTAAIAYCCIFHPYKAPTINGKLTVYDIYYNVKFTVSGEFKKFDGGFLNTETNTLYYVGSNVTFEEWN